jgi:hypothetical protein
MSVPKIVHRSFTGISTGGVNTVLPAVAGVRLAVVSYVVTGGDTVMKFYWRSSGGTQLSGVLYIAIGSGIVASGGHPNLPLLRTLAGEGLDMVLSLSYGTSTLEGHIAYTIEA